jgi:SAM-dependent methyltransferase
VTEVFNDAYAGTYDAVYSEKDYAGESQAIVSLIARFGDGSISSLLDLGCGTGRHAVLLSGLGFEVSGVDRSEPMLVQARERAKQSNADITFTAADVRFYASGRQFDAVLMNFNVLGYMSTNDDFLNALNAARGNLRKGGLFIADFWYGPAVVRDPPSQSARQISTASGPIVRSSSGQHLPNEQSCIITIDLGRADGTTGVETTEEVHRVRYFFPLELEMALRLSGFRLLALCGFPSIDEPVHEHKWGAVFVASAT